MTEGISKTHAVGSKQCHSCLREIDPRAKRCPYCTAIQLNLRAMAYQSIGIILVFVLFILLLRFLVVPFGEDQPKFAGRNFPATKYDLDFTKRYDVILGSARDNKEASALKGVKFLGWVGTDGNNSSLSSYEFNRWIVLEQNDGKKIFVPSHTVSMIIEAEEVN